MDFEKCLWDNHPFVMMKLASQRWFWWLYVDLYTIIPDLFCSSMKFGRCRSLRMTDPTTLQPLTDRTGTQSKMQELFVWSNDHKPSATSASHRIFVYSKVVCFLWVTLGPGYSYWMIWPDFYPMFHTAARGQAKGRRALVWCLRFCH